MSTAEITVPLDNEGFLVNRDDWSEEIAEGLARGDDFELTSLLRELVPVPMAFSASTTITSRPSRASARATARPTTPAPMTRQSSESTPTLHSGVYEDALPTSATLQARDEITSS